MVAARHVAAARAAAKLAPAASEQPWSQAGVARARGASSMPHNGTKCAPPTATGPEQHQRGSRAAGQHAQPAGQGGGAAVQSAAAGLPHQDCQLIQALLHQLPRGFIHYHHIDLQGRAAGQQGSWGNERTSPAPLLAARGGAAAHAAAPPKNCAATLPAPCCCCQGRGMHAVGGAAGMASSGGGGPPARHIWPRPRHRAPGTWQQSWPGSAAAGSACTGCTPCWRTPGSCGGGGGVVRQGGRARHAAAETAAAAQLGRGGAAAAAGAAHWQSWRYSSRSADMAAGRWGWEGRQAAAGG